MQIARCYITMPFYLKFDVLTKLENNIDVGSGIGGSREGGVEAHCRTEDSNQLIHRANP